MNNLERTIPVVLVVVFGILAILGLLFFPALADLLTSWASFLAAVALILGTLNLFGVHLTRVLRRNGYSALLIVSMLIVFLLAITDQLGITDRGVLFVFSRVQAPLEAAMASLLAFFLLFAAVRMLRRQKN